MDKKSKEEFIGLVSEALNDVMIPALESMEDRLKDELASKKDLEEVQKRLGGVESTLDSLDRKFDAQQVRLDRHDKRIVRLEEKAGFAN